MNEIVLDSSVAMAWCFEDERSAFADAVLDSLRGGAAHVPAIWPIEVANVLAMAERKTRLTPAKSGSFLDFLGQLSIHVDGEAPGRAWTALLSIARTEKLTAYDACYLELALRLKLPLATSDRALGAAARRMGVSVLRAAHS